MEISNLGRKQRDFLSLIMVRGSNVSFRSQLVFCRRRKIFTVRPQNRVFRAIGTTALMLWSEKQHSIHGRQPRFENQRQENTLTSVDGLLLFTLRQYNGRDFFSWPIYFSSFLGW